MKEKKQYSGIYRIVHWAMALTFMLLLITIFLRLTWMNKVNVSAIIQDFLKSTDQTLTQDQSQALAKKIRQPMWIWHIYLGYVLTGLLTLRFMLPFFGQMKFQNPFSKNLNFGDKFQRWTYLIFYLCVTISLITGLLIKFGPKTLEESMEDIHVLGIYYLVTFLVIHWAGVLIAEFTNQKGIVSRIISGSIKDK